MALLRGSASDQLGPVREHAHDDGIEVINGEHGATGGQRVHRRVHGAEPDGIGRVEPVEFDAQAIGARIIAMVDRTSSSPISLPTAGPSTVVSLSSLRPRW